MCEQTYREALAQFGVGETARQLQEACDRLKESLDVLSQPADSAAPSPSRVPLVVALAEVATLANVITPWIGPALVELEKVEALHRLQRQLMEAA